MVVGFLRKGKTYRAPCRWYPDGPIGTIEYYVASPLASYYEGDHIFFPLGYFGRDGIGGDVGELTGEGHVREIDGEIQAATEHGVAYTGFQADFRGETPYPGPLPDDAECECVPAPTVGDLAWVRDDTTEISIEVPEPPPPTTSACVNLPGGAYTIRRVTFSGIVGQPGWESAENINGTWDIVHTGGCHWEKPPEGEADFIYLNAFPWEWRMVAGYVEYRGAFLDGYADVVLDRYSYNPLLYVTPPPATVTLTIP